MPTITTTVTSAEASGVVTTQTTTEATPEPAAASGALPSSEGIRFLYHAGFSGRLEGAMMVCEDAGIPYTIDTDMAGYFGEGGISWAGGKSPGDGSYPAFFTPVLFHNGFTLGNTNAVTAYVGKLAGLYPTDFETDMAAMGMAGYAADIWSESYAARSSDDKGDAFLKDCDYDYAKGKAPGRFKKFCLFFEDYLAKSGGPYFHGEACNYSDWLVFSALRAAKGMWPAEMVDPFFQTPKLKGFFAAMNARKGSTAYLGTDKEMPMLYPSMLPEDYTAGTEPGF